MSGLIGEITGTNKQVTTDDTPDRKQAIEDIKAIKGWDVESNTEKFKIDLNRTDGRGGCDIEYSHSKFFIKDLTPESYNQFTLPVPTGNFQWRKEHFFHNEYFQWLTATGVRQWAKAGDQPYFEHNLLLRYTRAGYNELFLVDYEIYKKRYKTGLPNTSSWGNTQDLGFWAPGKIGYVNEFGKRVPEYWMCWELKDLEIWRKENGIWRRDTTFDDPKVYKDFVDNYKIEREKYLNANKK